MDRGVFLLQWRKRKNLRKMVKIYKEIKEVFGCSDQLIADALYHRYKPRHVKKRKTTREVDPRTI